MTPEVRLKMFQNWVLFGLLLLGNISVNNGQVCDSRNYILIEQPRRSTMAIFDYTVDTPLCDDGINEALWYRFLSNAGETVVQRATNNPVPINRCGTVAPIYIRGLNSNPSVDYTTLNATVCANYNGNPCYWMETIKIHRCPAQGNQSVYFLYRLKAPQGCSLSYCVGEKPPCNQGDYWDGFSCVNYFPPMTGFPLFRGPNTIGSGFATEVYFTCTVQYARRVNDTNARFRVTFLFDGKIMEKVNIMVGSTGRFEYLPSFNLTAANSSTPIVLGEKHLRGRLGREISCKAESYWSDYEPGNGPTNSTKLSQDKFYATMESEYSRYLVNPSQDSTRTIVFRSTLPLTCSHCAASSCCYYTFRMRSEAATSSCNLKWINQNTYTANAQVFVLPGLSQSSASYGMVFEPYVDDFLYNSSALWRDFIIPPVMVETASSSTPYLNCYSVTDPNIKTFDGVYFWNHQVGDFFLVRTSQSMEIQVRQETCFRGSCNCGVIVREGNSAFKISICEKGPWNATVQRSPTVIRLLSQDPVDNSTVYRDATGRIFSIRMPSGLRVEVSLVSLFFDINVYLPPIYHGKTSRNSMCGNSNRNRVDEIQDAGSFRIADSENFFKRQPQCSSVYNTAVKRCDCQDSNTFKCSNTDELLKIVSKPKDPLPDRWSTGFVCRQSGVFAAAATLDDSTDTDSDFILDLEDVYPQYSYDPNFGVNVSFTWPTPKGKTELSVMQYCEDIVNGSLAYQDCRNASVDAAEIIGACKSDIQVTDEWLPGGPYASVFEEGCVNQLAASINSSDADTNDTFNILMAVYEKTCTNQCNGHGTCVEANCVCNQGYIGTDCGIKENQTPQLTGISRSGVCDVRQRACDVISVFGSGIISTAALKCRFVDQSTGGYVETNGTFITSGEYSCPVPGTTTHRRKRAATAETTAISAKDVSITMNGVVYSNNISFVLFNSDCMLCNDSKTCSQRSDACTINGQCFANAAANANNRCLQCLPERSLSSWTDTTVVKEWNPCTRQCDFGARSRDVFCNGTMKNKEVELCLVTDCPENEDEKHEGVGFTFSEEDLTKILLEPQSFSNLIAEALNSYCLANVVKCCESAGVSSTRITSISYTSPNLTTYASGYPVLTANDSKVKIIVQIDEGRLQNECSETTGSLSTKIVYAQPMLLFDAVSGAKTDLETELGITITSTWSPTSATSEPVIPASVTSESVTSASVTSELVTPASVESEPVTPITPAPTTPVPVTPAPATPVPTTPVPVTPAPATPVPTTPVPVTPASATPVPTTPVAVTPAPITPDPIKPKSTPSTQSTSSKTFSTLLPIIGSFLLLRIVFQAT